ncbi:MAG TPA: ABC transporter substrate-binding protein [Acetobacteraceae bacterium]|jgi:peptide/nickel transport system substrate-binding protein|nr:ABC transporter substrate-binding protein [Acetobacteraceae bacterium]
MEPRKDETERRRRFRHALAAALALGTIVPGGVASAQSPVKALTVVPSADLPNIDPVFASVVITRIFGMMVYEELFAWDSNLQPKPQMVDTWTTSPDGLAWRFTLRDRQKFHDGAPVTSADVIASLKRWMQKDIVGQRLGAAIAGMSAVDDRTFELKLRQPVAYTLFALGSAIGQVPFIMPAKDLEGLDPSKPLTTENGSGPFRYNPGASVSGDRVVFDKNVDYVPRSEPPDGLAGGRVAKVDRVVWKIIPDASTAATALQRGEVDLVEQPSLDLVPLLAKSRDVHLQKLTEMANQVLLRPNALNPPFNDPRARLALAYLTDQSDILAAGFGDPQWWHPCDDYFVCGGPYGSDAGAAEYKKTNREKAKQLLAAAGYHGEKLAFVTTHTYQWIGQMSEVVAQELREAGVNVDLQFLDWVNVTGRLLNKDVPDKGGWNLFLTGASGPTMHSPLTNIGTAMTCDGKNWVGWPCDETAEKLRAAFLQANGLEAQKAAAVTLQAHLAEVQPYRVLGQYDQPVAMRADLSGFLMSPVIVYWNIAKP